MKPRVLLSGLALLATLVAVGWAIESGAFGEVLSKDWIDNSVRGKGVGGEVLFLCVAGLATAVALPRHLVSFLGGYAFGVGFGTALGLAGSGVDVGGAWRIGIAVALFLVSGVIGAWLYRKYRHGKTLGAEVDDALEQPVSSQGIQRG